MAVVLNLTIAQSRQSKVLDDDSDLYDDLLSIFNQMPVENETSVLILFLNGLVIAVSCYWVSTEDFNQSREFKESLPFSMIVFWLAFFLLFIES
jgi:hypothetical protein